MRQNLAYFLLSAAGCMYSPELSEARTLCAKNGALITVVDDFFDVGGSKEELENLIMLVELYDPCPLPRCLVHHLPLLSKSDGFLS